MRIDSTNSPDHQQVRKLRNFYFDPNRITDTQWEELGLSRKTIATVKNYLSKGGRFRKADDLKRIYGLRKEDADRLLPYVRIEGNDKIIQPYYAKRPVKKDSGYSRNYNTELRRSFQKSKVIVDINEADSTEWEALPGIGIKLAKRIVKFRDALGGFSTVDQVAEVYGIDDSLFFKIKPDLHIRSGIYKKVRINHWEADSLDTHPYIQKHEAEAIVKYRSQHGRFLTADDLGKINILSSEWIARLKPYLELE
jgi:competence protein ComEA